jgi:hypothetical protein
MVLSRSHAEMLTISPPFAAATFFDVVSLFKTTFGFGAPTRSFSLWSNQALEESPLERFLERRTKATQCLVLEHGG